MCESVFNKCSRQSSQTDTDEMLSNHMTCETVNSEVGVVKSSNCIINIEYMLQDEKIVFEVFKSTVDSNCVLKRNIVLNKSNDPSNDIKEFISSLSETASYGSMKINKSCQTDPEDLMDSEPKKRTKSPRSKKVAFECPEKDTTGKIDGTEYKEIYAVSSFKFIEPKPTVVSATKQNYCALDFDGTKSRKHKHSAKKQTNLIKVKSDTNILRVSNNLLKEKTNNCISEKVTSELTDANENNLKKEIKKKRHKSVEPTHKKQYGEHVKSDGAQFEIVLTPRKPKNLYNNKLEKDTETIHLTRRKPRKIIVKSNTLELLTKPEMKSVALQTTPSCFLEKNILLKDLYAKPYFNTVNNIKSLKSMDSGDANLEEVNLQQEEEPVKPHNYKTDVKKYKRRPFGELNLTKTVNPCIEIKNGPEHIEFPQKIRPTIPRRRIDAYESGADENMTVDKLKMETPVPSVRTKIPRLREGTTHLINDTVITEDLNTLRTHITSWLTNNRKQKNVNTEEYNKEIDELCSKITSLLHKNEENVVKKEENIEKPEMADSKSPREKFGAMKHETKRNIPLAKPVNNTVMQKTKSPRLQICHNTNVVIASENLAQNKLIDADEQKTIMRTAFRREMSNVSSKSAKSNKNDTKPVIPQNKNDEQGINKNSILRNENYPYTNLSKRLRYEAKCQMQEEEKQQKLNTTPNKSFASKKYEHTKINEQFFEQCMASRKRHNAFLCGTSSVTVNSQEKSTITSGQKRKSGIPLRSRTFTELTKPNTASTKPDKTNARCLSRNSLDTNVSELTRIKEPSLKHSKSAIFNSQNFEEFKTKTKCSTMEKSRPQNPGSIVNSTFLFTKVNMDSNAMSCFRKRKEYSNNLKLKKRIQSEEQQSSDVKQVTNRNKIQTSFKRKYTPPRPCLLPKFRQMSKNKNVSNIFAHMQEESDSKIVKTSAPYTTTCAVQPTEKTNTVLPTNKEKSSLFPYHFKPADCDNDYESLSDTDSTVPFLKPYPLVENSQVFMATNVKTSVKSKCKKPSINNTSEQLKPKVSLTKSTSKDKPRLSTKRASVSLKPKATRTSIKCNKEKNTTYAKQLEMRKALLGEIKACCSLCCKQNKESDSTFKKNTENNENQKQTTERTGLIGILKHTATSTVNTKKKSVTINETPQSIYKEDEEDIVLEPKVSYEYWRCAVAQNSPFAHKFLDSRQQENVQENKVNNSITDDDMTFYSSQSIAVNKPAISNSEDLHTDTTDSFKSTFNTTHDETNIENEALKVLLDKNQVLHRTESDPDSEYALICTLNKSETNKNSTVEQVDSGKLLEAKKSNIFKNINKFFRKKSSKTKCNTNNVS